MCDNQSRDRNEASSNQFWTNGANRELPSIVWNLQMKQFRCAIFVVTLSVGLFGQCARWNPQTDNPPAQELATFLQQNESAVNDDPCVIAALDMLGQERATAYIPELIKFLEFRRKFYWEGTGFNMHPVTEIDHYPAAMALFQIGKPALPALRTVILQEKPDSLKFKNAVNTVMLIHREDFPAGVRFLRRSALSQEKPENRQNLDDAVELAQTFCTKSTRAQCAAAARENTSPDKNP
jgi:hypothetical protein